MFSAMKGAAERGLCRCRARATSSLPVPDSPLMRTVMFERASRPMARNTSCIDGASPMMSGLLSQRLGRRRRLLLCPAGAAHLIDGLVEVEGLRQVLEGTAVEGGHGAVEVRVRGHDDDRQVRDGGVDLLQQIEAVDAGHADVGQDHVGALALQRLHDADAVGEAGHIHVGLAQRALQHPADGAVVVDDPDLAA
jgi:hypothetical protein